MRYVRVGALNPPASGRSAWVRSEVERAIRLGVHPAVVPAQEVKAFTAYLPPAIADHLEEQAIRLRRSPAEVAAGMLVAMEERTGVDSHAIESAPALTSARTVIRGRELVRPILHGLLDAMDVSLRNGKVFFAEASTGAGKGRFIAAQAVTHASEGRQVVIAAPLAVCRQLLDTIELLQPESRPHLVLGRPNFIDPIRLSEWLKDNPCAGLETWLREGGKPVMPETQRLSDMLGAPLAWLYEDAQHLAGADTLDVADCRLERDPAGKALSPAEEIYQQHRSLMRKSSIVLCSHHFLAADAWLRQLRAGKEPAGDETPGLSLQPEDNNLLPERIDVLLVDEAHQLEAALGAVTTEVLHVNALRRRLYDEGKTKALKACLKLAEYVSSLERRLPMVAPVQDLNDEGELVRHVRDLLEALPKGSKNHPLPPVIARAKKVLNNIVGGFGTISMSLTPAKRFAVLAVGRSNLSGIFEALWDRVGGAGLVSATLYNGNGSAQSARMILNVPAERSAFAAPVIPNWVARGAILQPTRVAAVPDSKDPEPWLESLASGLDDIVGQAVGGTLVLLTAYDHIEALTKIIQARYPHLVDRLISQSSETSVTSYAEVFRSKYAQGLRPIWLGLGAAGTGLDLTDMSQAAENDNLLSDLVVTRLPFGTNRSLTHHRRVKALGFQHEIEQMMKTLRQWIGRLVRREGAPRKKLWLLDARIDDSRRTWTSQVRRYLTRFDVAERAAGVRSKRSPSKIVVK